MKPYPQYKDSGVKWLGGIPEHWHRNYLKRCCEQITDGSHFSPPTSDDGMPYISVKDVGIDTIDTIGCKKISIDDFLKLEKGGCRPDPGDILLTKDGTIGRAAIVSKDNNFVILSSLGLVKPNYSIVTSEFLKYYLISGLNIDQMYSFIHGSALTRLTITLIKHLYTVIPPIKEQQQIANYLDHKTKQIDTLIEKKKRLIDLLKEERTSVINEAVTKGLDPNVKTKDSGIEWLGDIPEHWEVKKVKFLLSFQKNALKTGPFGSQLRGSELTLNGPYKVYNQRNVLDDDYLSGMDYISQDKFTTLKDFEIFADDILMTSRGTIGYCSIFPENSQKGVLHPCLIRIQLNKKLISNIWFITYCNYSSYFKENVRLNSNSTTIEVIYGYTLRDVIIPAPPVIEQKTILNFLKKETTRIDTIITKTEKEIELIQEYRTALISEVVTGKIDVRDWKE